MEGEYFKRYYEDSVRMNVNTLIEMLRENMSYILPTSFSKSTARILVTVGEKEKGIIEEIR